MKRFLAVAIVAMFIFCSPLVVEADASKRITICQSGCDYQNIEEIIAGDVSWVQQVSDLTIWYGAGEWELPFDILYRIPVDKLTIEGEENEQTRFRGGADLSYVEDSYTDLVLKNIVVEGDLKLYGFTNVTFQNVVFVGGSVSFQGMFVPSVPYNVTLENTTFRNLNSEYGSSVPLFISNDQVWALNFKAHNITVENSKVDNILMFGFLYSSAPVTMEIDGIFLNNVTYQTGALFYYRSQKDANHHIRIKNVDFSNSQNCSVISTNFNLDPSANSFTKIPARPLSFTDQYQDHYIVFQNSKLNCVETKKGDAGTIYGDTDPIYIEKSNIWTMYPTRGKNVIEENAKIFYEIEEIRSITMKPGETDQVEDIFKTYPEVAKKLTFTSSDSSIAEIKDGKVLSKKEGVATLTAKPNEFETFILKVEVIGNPVTASMQIMIIMLMVVVILATTLVVVYKKKKN